jgi:pimeloyl-ACP methyl ester carboxylesterase
LGCFNNFEWFSFRPVVRKIFPQSPENIKTGFLFNTRAKPNLATQGELSYLDLRNSSSNILKSLVNKLFLNPRLHTKILIHGWQDNPQSIYWTNMTSAFLARDDLNVIRVNWQIGASGSYNQATQNTRVVGAQVAVLIHHLESQFGMSGAQFHIVGHSFGAQTAGYAGERVKGLGRISGLDPAARNFQYFHASIRLDPSGPDSMGS